MCWPAVEGRKTLGSLSVQMCVRAHMCVCVQVGMCVCVCEYVHAYMCCMPMCVHACVCAYVFPTM